MFSIGSLCSPNSPISLIFSAILGVSWISHLVSNLSYCQKVLKNLKFVQQWNLIYQSILWYIGFNTWYFLCTANFLRFSKCNIFLIIFMQYKPCHQFLFYFLLILLVEMSFKESIFKKNLNFFEIFSWNWSSLLDQFDLSIKLLH